MQCCKIILNDVNNTEDNSTIHITTYIHEWLTKGLAVLQLFILYTPHGLYYYNKQSFVLTGTSTISVKMNAKICTWDLWYVITLAQWPK